MEISKSSDENNSEKIKIGDDELFPKYEARFVAPQAGTIINSGSNKILYPHRNEIPMACNKKITSNIEGMIQSCMCGTICPFFKIEIQMRKEKIETTPEGLTLPPQEQKERLVPTGYAAAVLRCEAQPIQFTLDNMKLDPKENK